MAKNYSINSKDAAGILIGSLSLLLLSAIVEEIKFKRDKKMFDESMKIFKRMNSWGELYALDTKQARKIYKVIVKLLEDREGPKLSDSVYRKLNDVRYELWKKVYPKEYNKFEEEIEDILS